MDIEIINDNEDCYGFLDQLIKMFEYSLNEDPDQADLFNEAIEEAKQLQEEDDDNYLYKVYYNPMGAFVFKRMIEAI